MVRKYTNVTSLPKFKGLWHQGDMQQKRLKRRTGESVNAYQIRIRNLLKKY